MCTNRLVQHGLQVRLQLFKTQNKGWGIRCLDDVAKGSFVCIYAGEERERTYYTGFMCTEGMENRHACRHLHHFIYDKTITNDCFLSPFTLQGKILTDDFADKEGLEMGDEYFANLDHIESVENFKEGYESEAHCSDSEGSGVDVARIKIQPSALVSSNPVGRPPKKGEFHS